jgi:hypothetical protein
MRFVNVAKPLGFRGHRFAGSGCITHAGCNAVKSNRQHKVSLANSSDAF